MKEWDSFFLLTEEEKEIDRKNGIKRKPALGCLIAVIGTIIFWYLFISLNIFIWNTLFG